MLAYLDQNNLPLARTPYHLLEKETDRLINAWHSTFGIRALAIHDSGIVHVDISAASRENVFQWLSDIGCVCVDLAAEDIQTFAGRSVASLAAADLLNNNAAVRQGCSRLTIDEVMSTVEELIVLAHNASAVAYDQRQERLEQLRMGSDASLQNYVQADYDREDDLAMQRLRDAGLEVPDRVDLEPQQAPVVDYSWEADAGIKPRAEVDPFSF